MEFKPREEESCEKRVVVDIMDPTYDKLADRAIELLEKSEKYRILILLIGTPGSGKSTLAQKVVDRINSRCNNKSIIDDGNRTIEFDSLVTNKVTDRIPLIESNDMDNDTIDEKDVVGDPMGTPKRLIVSNEEIIIRGKGSKDTQLSIRLPSSPISFTSETNSSGNSKNFAQVVPMDGFHLPRSILNKFKDPQFANLRRGAPFTFDSSLVDISVELLKATCDVDYPLSNSSSKNENGEKTLKLLNGSITKIPDVYLPNFSHEIKDPTPYGIKVPSETRIILMEGLYLLLDDDEWSKIGHALKPGEVLETNNNAVPYINYPIDTKIPIPENKNFEFWKIDIDEQRARHRVAMRHLASGLADSIAAGEKRYDINDVINGRLVDKHSFNCDLRILSIDDED